MLPRRDGQAAAGHATTLPARLLGARAETAPRFPSYPSAVSGPHITACLLTLMSDRKLPSFDELPDFKGKPGCAWDVWGRDDQLGTINLLTPDVVKRAMTEEVQ